MQRRIMTFAAGVSCLISASLLPADSFEPAFVAYKPKVLVTPDNLPIMRWDQPLWTEYSYDGVGRVTAEVLPVAWAAIPRSTMASKRRSRTRKTSGRSKPGTR